MASKPTNTRKSFASIAHPMEYPDFLEVQLKSFQDFFQLNTPAESRKKEGLFKVFSENFPIEDTRNNFKLLFEDYFVDPPKYSINRPYEEVLTAEGRLPAPLRHAILIECARLYAHREGETTRTAEVPFTLSALILPYRLER